MKHFAYPKHTACKNSTFIFLPASDRFIFSLPGVVKINQKKNNKNQPQVRDGENRVFFPSLKYDLRHSQKCRVSASGQCPAEQKNTKNFHLSKLIAAQMCHTQSKMVFFFWSLSLEESVPTEKVIVMTQSIFQAA